MTLPQLSTTLTATVTDDGLPENSDVSLTWAQTAGPPGPTITDPTAPVTGVSFTETGVYQFTLTADDTELVATDTVTITVEEPSTGPSSVLFVAGNASPPSADRDARDRLLAAGYDVTVAAVKTTTADDASSHDLVVISSSISPTALDPAFATIATPIVTWEPYIFGTLKLTTSAGEYGTNTTITITEPTHPIAAGLTDNPRVTNGAYAYTYGVPAPAATTIATIANPRHRLRVRHG